MPEKRKDVVEFKPQFYGLSIDLIEIWRRFTTKPKIDPVLVVAQRFLRIFQDHGVAISQIPRLIPGLTLEQLRSPEALLAALTPQIIEKTADLFQIQRKWLEGTDDQIYQDRWCYKRPENFFADLAALKKEENIIYPIVAYCCDQKLDRHRRREQPIILAMIEKCADIDGREIRRYRLYREGWTWNYWKGRIQIKAMIRIVETQLNIPVPLIQVSRESLQQIEEGHLVPTRARNYHRLHDVSLEDYCVLPEESRVSKEADELPQVLEFIKALELDTVMDRHPSLKTFQRPSFASLLSQFQASSPSIQSGS